MTCRLWILLFQSCWSRTLLRSVALRSFYFEDPDWDEILATDNDGPLLNLVRQYIHHRDVAEKTAFQWRVFLAWMSTNVGSGFWISQLEMAKEASLGLSYAECLFSEVSFIEGVTYVAGLRFMDMLLYSSSFILSASVRFHHHLFFFASVR